MSLTSLLQVAEVRAQLAADFQTPKMGPVRRILAAPLTTNFGLVGTAFDYLVRMQIQRGNPREGPPHFESLQVGRVIAVPNRR